MQGVGLKERVWLREEDDLDLRKEQEKGAVEHRKVHAASKPFPHAGMHIMIADFGFRVWGLCGCKVSGKDARGIKLNLRGAVKEGRWWRLLDAEAISCGERFRACHSSVARCL